MQNSIICDIDGVILKCPHWKDLDDFYTHLDECIPVEWAVYMIKGLHAVGINILFLTARNVKCFGYTKYQLEQLFDFPIHLYMRDRQDTRPDYEIKKDYTQMLMQNYKILFCVDDNEQNCEMFRSLGLPTLHLK